MLIPLSLPLLLMISWAACYLHSWLHSPRPVSAGSQSGFRVAHWQLCGSQSGSRLMLCAHIADQC